MKINQKHVPIRTHEGAIASRVTPIEELRRTLIACMLWEGGFYESGESIADRLKDLVQKCSTHDVSELAIEARKKHNLRHAPLLIARELARYPSRCADGLIARTICEVVQRADELAEFLAIYWKDGKTPISKQVKKGLACAFTKFNEYALAKYNRDNAVKLRDVLFMVHAKPKDDVQAALWKRLVDGNLVAPDTWEVALSSGADKKETFERLLKEGKLGYMALLRNLRNMKESGVDERLVFGALQDGAEKSKALPFRYIAAARAVPAWESKLDSAMQIAMQRVDKLTGKTVVLVDVSGSMDTPISSKSDLMRIDAASALAVLLRGVCESAEVFTFSRQTVQVPDRQGMALADAITKSQPHGGTELGQSIKTINNNVKYDRLIIFTDEQSSDAVGAPNGKGYIINVATNKNGVGYGDWVHINGFSEAVVQYIVELEQSVKLQ